jgi:hypothetical protein
MRNYETESDDGDTPVTIRERNTAPSKVSQVNAEAAALYQPKNLFPSKRKKVSRDSQPQKIPKIPTEKNRWALFGVQKTPARAAKRKPIEHDSEENSPGALR